VRIGGLLVCVLILVHVAEVFVYGGLNRLSVGLFLCGLWGVWVWDCFYRLRGIVVVFALGGLCGGCIVLGDRVWLLIVEHAVCWIVVLVGWVLGGGVGIGW